MCASLYNIINPSNLFQLALLLKLLLKHRKGTWYTEGCQMEVKTSPRRVPGCPKAFCLHLTKNTNTNTEFHIFCYQTSTEDLPDPIPSIYTKHAAWIKDIHGEMLRWLHPLAELDSFSAMTFIKLTQAKMSLTLRIHWRPNSWFVSHSTKSIMSSAMSASKKNLKTNKQTTK